MMLRKDHPWENYWGGDGFSLDICELIMYQVYSVFAGGAKRISYVCTEGMVGYTHLQYKRIHPHEGSRLVKKW